ncbi:MAG: tetratricopeptide repeat protein [Spirochaetales bacterium]|nr:tetratricopeptide repeat protein [Spirochaetales bacterium]
MSLNSHVCIVFWIVAALPGCGPRAELSEEELAIFREAQEQLAELKFDSALDGLGRIKARTVETVGMRARIHFHTRQYREAERVLREGLDEWPENPYLMLWLGRIIFLEDGRNDEAIEIFRIIVQNDPGNFIGRYYLGRCFERDKKMDLALNQYYNALGVEYEVSRIHVHLADLFSDLQMQERSDLHARKVAALNVNAADIALMKALAERRKKDPASAVVADGVVQEKNP